MARKAPIFRFNRERTTLVSRTIDRVVSNTDDVLHTLNEAAYHETRRLDGSKRPKDIQRLDSWRTLARRLGRMSDRERSSELRSIVRVYAEDIAGNFDPRVYRFSTRLLPPLVTMLLAPSTLPALSRKPAQLFSLEALGNKVHVQGDTALLRQLSDKGTLIYVPTHSSNMDSIVFGFALEHSGLAPATYGAGKNLFTNPILSFFMRNLGAYRVDRRLRHQLYKNCLKAYSTVLLENGFHSLFFPGGTRSRSGGLEQKLKLGLMGSGLEAYTHSLLAGKERKVFFVPATINYLITLEAETLIEDFLSESGKARYIIEDDESTRPSRVLSFIHKLLKMAGSVVIQFGQPLDPFGNAVDADGCSRDQRGRPVETASYIRNLESELSPNRSRDMQYTRQLGEAIAAAYQQNTVVMSTHIVAAACFARLRQEADSQDLFTVLRHRDTVTIPQDELAEDIAKMRDRLLDLEREQRLIVSKLIRSCSGAELLAQAMRAFNGYHASPVIAPRHSGIALCDPKLLLYYQNRLASCGVGYDPGRPDTKETR